RDKWLHAAAKHRSHPAARIRVEPAPLQDHSRRRKLQPSRQSPAEVPPGRTLHRSAASPNDERAAPSSSLKRQPARWSCPAASRSTQLTSASPARVPPPTAERNAPQPEIETGAHDRCSSPEQP